MGIFLGAISTFLSLPFFLGFLFVRGRGFLSVRSSGKPPNGYNWRLGTRGTERQPSKIVTSGAFSGEIFTVIPPLIRGFDLGFNDLKWTLCYPVETEIKSAFSSLFRVWFFCLNNRNPKNSCWSGWQRWLMGTTVPKKLMIYVKTFVVRYCLIFILVLEFLEIWICGFFFVVLGYGWSSFSFILNWFKIELFFHLPIVCFQI